MKSKRREENIPSFLLDKLWEIYLSTDEKRKNAFYYLFSSMAIFMLLWLANVEKFKLPLLETEVSLFTALTLFPSFILILTVRYLYLCAHSINTYSAFLELYYNSYRKELRFLKYSFHRLHGVFKQRDFVENLNIYLFPLRPSQQWDAAFKKGFLWGSKLLLNVALLFTIAVPFGAYIYMVIWLINNHSRHISELTRILIIAFYIFLGILFLLSPIYFYYRAKPSRDILKKHKLFITRHK